MQTCINCNNNKNLSEFYTRKRKTKTYIHKLCKECDLQKHKDYYLKHKEKIIEKNSQYQKDNSDKVKEYQDNYHKKESVKNKRNTKRREKRKINIEYALYCNLSARITKLLKRKDECTSELLGCSIAFFKKWIEYQFDSKMNWENYGIYWTIDHVKPCKSFNLKNIIEQRICFSWKNCRPFEKIRNIIKGDQIDNYAILLQELKVYYYLQHVQIAGNP